MAYNLIDTRFFFMEYIDSYIVNDFTSEYIIII